MNPIFNETFQFSVPLAELAQRKLHFSVYDFDRFSRHDLIGQVVLDNLLELAEQPPDRPLWRDILEGGSVSGSIHNRPWCQLSPLHPQVPVSLSLLNLGLSTSFFPIPDFQQLRPSLKALILQIPPFKPFHILCFCLFGAHWESYHLDLQTSDIPGSPHFS